jgi:transcriptional regulator with XRE-family HTH domain
MPKKQPEGPPLISLDGVTGHERRTVSVNNAIVEAVREQGNPLCTLLAETRWLILRLTRKQFVTKAKVDYKAVQNSETAGSRPEEATYAAIHAYWKKRGIAEEVREQLLDLIIRHRYADTAGPDRSGADASEPPMGHGMVNLYRRWSIKAGRERFEKASKLTYGGLLQRAYVGMIPDWSEVRTLARKLKEDVDTARELWLTEKRRQLMGRGVAAPLAELLLRLETAHDGFRHEAPAIRKHLGCTDKTAQKLFRYDIVPLTDIEESARAVIPADEWERFAEEWSAAEGAEAERDTFGKAFVRARDARGLGNRQLAMALDIRPPEDRPDAPADAVSARREGFRPSAAIRSTCDLNSFSRVAPAGVLIGLVGRPDHRIGTVPEPAYLTRLFCDQLAEWARKSGSDADASPLRIARALWGVELEQLVGKGRTKKDLLRIEQGRTDSVPAALLRKTELLGQARLEEAQSRLEVLLSRPYPQTVTECVSTLKGYVGGYTGYQKALAGDVDNHVGMTAEHLQRIENGKEVPALPTLLRMVTAVMGADADKLLREGEWQTGSPEDEAHQALTAMREDWFRKYPDFVEAHPHHPWPHPMARFFAVVFGQHAENIARFREAHIPDVHQSVIARNFIDVNAGKSINWTNLSRYLDAVDMRDTDPRRRYAVALHAAEGDVDKALRTWTALLRTGRNAQDPAAFALQLGLTTKERNRNAKLLGIPREAKA